MAASASLLAGAVAVLLVARSGSALKCYSCYKAGSVSPRCGDPFSLRGPEHLDDCDSAKVRPPGATGRSFCKKVKQIKDGVVRVTRLCDWAANETAACDGPPSDHEDLRLVHCSACDTDGCNCCAAVLPTLFLLLQLQLLLPLLAAA
ncbi:uncharacterized protein LOC134543181 [Bacillus rossius redtenbacheri]|uniref:uncharacterized protein LOC134543181 n=1 Tax=Bacillus rossius redtenbacheri TaxID=93214 RepID=UPI002FDECDBA